MTKERIAAAIKAAYFEAMKRSDRDTGEDFAYREWPHSKAKHDYDDVLADREPVVVGRVA